MCKRAHVCKHAVVHVWLVGNLEESYLRSVLWASKVFRFGSKCLDVLSHLAALGTVFDEELGSEHVLIKSLTIQKTEVSPGCP